MAEPGVVDGASLELLGVAERRVLVEVVGLVLFVAIVAGRGWPVVGACCSAAVVVRCVAVLVGESSPAFAT